MCKQFGKFIESYQPYTQKLCAAAYPLMMDMTVARKVMNLEYLGEIPLFHQPYLMAESLVELGINSWEKC